MAMPTVGLGVAAAIRESRLPLVERLRLRAGIPWSREMRDRFSNQNPGVRAIPDAIRTAT
jgi:hypothetical protein